MWHTLRQTCKFLFVVTVGKASSFYAIKLSVKQLSLEMKAQKSYVYVEMYVRHRKRNQVPFIFIRNSEDDLKYIDIDVLIVLSQRF